MLIQVQCPNGHKLRVKGDYAGKKVRCPACKAVLLVPGVQTSAAATAPTATTKDEEKRVPDKPASDTSRMGPTHKRSSARAEAGRGKLAAVIGASAALLLALAFAGYFVFRPKTPVAFEALSAEQFDASWKHDLDVKDRPAGEVLAELIKKFGMKLDSAPAQEKALAKPISLQLKGVSRWQLLEEVARQIGLYPVYKTVFTGRFGEPGGSQTFVPGIFGEP